jgi:hypothetical protein
METLKDFLLERIQEEEALAQAAIDAHRIGHAWDDAHNADAAHFARWNPWRVLASCVSKRLIIAAHRDVGRGIDGRADPDNEIKAQACSTCGRYDQYAVAWPCYTLRVLALDWVDHPSYRREWRPQRLNSGVGRAPTPPPPSAISAPAQTPAQTAAPTPDTRPAASSASPPVPPRQRPGAA